MPPLYAAALVVLLEALCFTTGFPVINYYAEQLGGDALWIGVVFGLVSWPKVLSNPLWGLVSERIGRRPVLAINTLGTLTGSIVWALAPGIGWLAVSRSFIGVFGGQAGMAQAIAADVSPPEKRSAAMGVLGGAFALSLSIGPPLGGIVAHVWSYAAVGWLCAGFQLLSLAVIVFVLPETREWTKHGATAEESASGTEQSNDMYGGGRSAIILLLLVTLVLWSGLSMLNSTYGLLCEKIYGFDVTKTGYALGALGLGLALVQGGAVRALTQRMSERTIAVIGSILLIWGLAILSKPPPLWGLWLGTGLYAIGVALATPCLTGLLTRLAPRHRQGAIAGVNQGVIAAGRGIGTMAGGALYRPFDGPRVPYVAAAAIAFLALFLLLFVRSIGREERSAKCLQDEERRSPEAPESSTV